MVNETEQQLRETIASQKAALAELPSLKSIVEETGITSPETKARAQQIKELSDYEEQLELLLEFRRVEAVVKLQDELHPPENPEDCPICLETIKHVNVKTTKRFKCCGGLTCTQCNEEREDRCEKEGFDKMLSDKCPLCRVSLPGTNKDAAVMVLEHSNKGKAWAQVMIGAWCLDATLAKDHGLSFDKKKGWKLMEQAADQGDPSALSLMAMECGDEEMHMHYLKRAADLGYPAAQHNLAILFYEMNNDEERYLHYLTLAASQGGSNSSGALGALFMRADCGLKESLILAKHYAGKSLEDAYAVSVFSYASYFLAMERYEGIVDIPGHSPVPSFLFWGRRAVEGTLSVEKKDFMVDYMSDIEEHAKSRCANCMKEAGCSSFKRCVRCLGAWYCGKECQVQHWKAGHKIDCVSINRNK